MKTLLDHLNKANWLDIISESLVEGDEIIACFLCGSRSTPYVTEESDYDIQVLTKYTCYFFAPVAGEYNGLHLHWWYIPWDVLTATLIAGKNSHIYFTGMYSWKYLDQECCLYINPKYCSFIQCWLNHSKNLSNWALFNLAYLYQSQYFYCYYNSFDWSKSNWIWLDFQQCSTQEVIDFKRKHFALHDEQWYINQIKQGWEKALKLPNPTNWYLQWHQQLLSLLPKDDSE